MRFCVLFILLAGLMVSLEAAKWDVQYWQLVQWKNWERGRCKLYTVGETRLTHDLRRFTYYKIAECFAYRALDDLDLEIHYSYVNTRSSGSTHFTNRSRIELEVNPSFTLRNGVELKWRNRMEFIKKQDILHVQYVARQRFMLIFPVHWGRITSLKMADELFYDLATKRFTQNRIYPLEVTLSLTDQATLTLFIMYRSLLSSDKWYRQAAIGSEISF